MKLVIVICMMCLLVGCSEDITTNEAESNNTAVENNNSEVDSNDTEADEIMPVAEYHKITAEEAKEMMVDGNMILDVRTEDEYNSGYIPNAILLPVDQVESGNLELLPDKDQIILVYCRSGNRSGIAARALVDFGYTNVFDFGGITDWPYEIVLP